MADQLYINGVLADLPSDFIVALTIQNYSPLTPDFVRVSFSNRLRLPLTNTNKLALGLLNSLASTSQIYKTPIQIRYVRGGVEVIPDGFMLVQQILTDVFQCVLYANGLDIYSQLKGKVLTDLDTTDINAGWNGADMDAKRSAVHLDVNFSIDHIRSAVVNHGWNLGTSGGDVTVTSLVCYGYKLLLERMFSQAVYTWDWGNLNGVFPDYKFLSLALLQGNKLNAYRYTDRFIASLEFAAESSGLQSWVAPAAQVVMFDTTMIAVPFWDPITGLYTTVNGDTANIFAQVTFAFHGVVVAALGAVTISLYRDVTLLHSVVVALGTTQVVDLQSTGGGLGAATDFKNGYVYKVVVTSTGVAQVKAGATFKNTFVSYGTSVTPYVYFNELLPQINQLDFFKDFLFRFGQIPKQRNKKLAFKSLGEILNNQTNVNDWNGKRDPLREEITLTLHDLAQSNHFRYNDTDSLGADYCAGVFNLDDGNLPLEKSTLSIFDSIADDVTLGIKCAQVPTGAAGPFSPEIGNRLFAIRNNDNSDAPTVKFPGQPSRNTYSVGTFLKTGSLNGFLSMSYQNVLDEKYSNAAAGLDNTTGFLVRLKNAKFVRRWYNFNDMDIAKFDEHKLTADEGAYFLFPIFESYVPGKVTQVDMLKI